MFAVEIANSREQCTIVEEKSASLSPTTGASTAAGKASVGGEFTILCSPTGCTPSGGPALTAVGAASA